MALEHTVIETPIEAGALADILLELPDEQPTMYLCVEGGQFGSTPLLSILVHYPATVRHCYFVHIYLLGHMAFETPGDKGLSLGDILQKPTIPKVVFDLLGTARLLCLYGIPLRGVLDLQLMGTISRRSGRYAQHADDLITCIRRDSLQASASINRWEESRSLNDPYKALIKNYLPTDAKEYALAGVVGLPTLTWVYLSRFLVPWREMLVTETRERVRLAQGDRPDGDEREVDYPLLCEHDLVVRVIKLITG